MKKIFLGQQKNTDETFVASHTCTLVTLWAMSFELRVVYS